MSKEFWKATGIRAIRTVCQTAVAMIGTSVAMSDVDWKMVASASVLSGILSVLTSVATGLPEAEYKEHVYMSAEEPEDSWTDESYNENFDYGEEVMIHGEE